jgi:unsaturated chondroitin disaccharide hydrolase
MRRLATAEPLERRRLLAATPLVLTGGTGADTFYLRESADRLTLDVWQNAAVPGAGTPTQALALSGVSTVTVNAGGTTDAVTVDFTNGLPASIAVNGLSAATTSVTVVHASAVSVSATAITVGSSAVAFADVQAITVAGGTGNDTLTQTAQPLAPVTFLSGGGADTLNLNAGTFTIAGDPAGLTANVSGELFLTAAASGTGINLRRFTALNVLAGGSVTVDAPVTPGDRAVVVVSSLSVASTGRVDLTANDMIVHNGAVATVAAEVASSMSAFATAASTLNRMYAVGVIANHVTTGGAAIYTTFDGQAVTTTDVLAKYTLVGDANLDGVVNAADYTRVDAGFAQHLTGWANGDFNGDGVVDGSDYALMDDAFNTAPAAPSSLVSQLYNALDVATDQTRKTVAAIGTSAHYPDTVNPDGTWSWVADTDWTAGTWAGLLWAMYQATGNAYYETEATNFTTPLSVDDTYNGDVGPRIYDSFYPLLQQQPTDTSAINVMLAAAASKATAFNATVGGFEAWYSGNGTDPSASFDVLTDYMMDSQLLFWAAAESGNQTYYNEAVADADLVAKYNVRSDGSTAQFSFFNPTTGAFGDNQTYQGYSASSAWSRGQAWAIYAFTQCYADTGQASFLSTAEATANYYLAHLPSDDVPYWDFNAPVTSTTPRDTSAAAVAASGLLMLSKQIATSDPTNSARYRTAAGNILASLASPAYLANPTAAGDGVLLHAAVNVPAGITDNSATYGDYFFVQAINEYLAG